MPGRMKVAILLVGLCSAAAYAGLSDPGLFIRASNDDGVAELSIPVSSFFHDPAYGEYSYFMGPTELWDGPDLIAELISLQLIIIDDPIMEGPKVILNFGVEAGASDTTFEIQPGVATTFIPDEFSAARGSWGFTLQEGNGDQDPTAYVSSTDPNYGIYRSWYNGMSWYHSDTGGLQVTGETGTLSVDGNRPDFGYEDIAGDLTSFRLGYSFELSQQDRFTTNSSLRFLTPEPASMMLLSTALVLLTARRR